ncbi:tRNA wybutosine-synthesizing protein 3 homolog [Clavelina lepadiformis]|uniref:tRNA wybutosine-synthesizing protein 3 homolog n=1 Tax=Clavelina lepadiformis TaxID=159417 RepID=UPI004041FD20
MNDFLKWKSCVLSRIDLSKKGSIDAAIQNLVSFINEQNGYCTTSSCSGRIVLLSNDAEQSGGSGINQKKTKKCTWHLVSHETVELHDVLKSLHQVKCESKLKFEGFIMHIKCCGLEEARLMQNAAISAGHRNSGITLGKQGRNIMVAVRGTQCLEVPITDVHGARLTSDLYIKCVLDKANQKLKDNFERIVLFETKLRSLINNLRFSENKTCKKLSNSSSSKTGNRKHKGENPGHLQNEIDVDDVQFLFSNGDEYL